MSDIENVEDKEEIKNFLELSDEEISNMNEADIPNLFDESDEEDEVVQEEEEQEKDEPAKKEIEEEDTEDTDTPSKNTDSKYNEKEVVTTSENEVESKDKESEVIDKPKELGLEDYKAVYDRLLNQPIKANGKNLKLDNVDDVIKLVQMGANYNLKMAGIKEQLPYLKILENNNLLNERDLSYLIDLKEGKKEAIARLIKENGIDIYDFDTEQNKDYVPINRNVSIEQIELEDIISEISNSPKFSQTMEVIQKVWDEGSRDAIREQPQRLRIIHEQIESGLFNEVWQEVESQIAKGNVPVGTSAIQAYEYFGNILAQEGKLNKYSNVTGTTSNTSTDTRQQESLREQQNLKEEELKRKRRSAIATPNKSTSSSGTTKSISPLNLSDEEFSKLGDPSLM